MQASSENICPCCGKKICPILNPSVPFGDCDHEICEECRLNQSDNICDNFQTIMCPICKKPEDISLKQLKKSQDKQRK